MKQKPSVQIREALPQIIELFNQNDVDYWIDFGTLLGAVRDKDVIDWDLDGDISYVYTPEQHSKILGCLSPVLNNQPLINMISYWDGGTKLVASDTHIDCYPWIKGPQISQHPQSCFGIGPWPSSDIESFKHIDFLGVQTRIPINYETRLARLYGNWRIPVAEKFRNKPYWSVVNTMGRVK